MRTLRLIIWICFFTKGLCYQGFAQPTSIFFDHVTTAQGLSNNVIWSIVKDKRGFLWLGTEDGLNRFDGKNFKIYRHSVQDENSLPYNIVYSIEEDDQGTLWIGTFNGLCSINPLNDEITRYRYPSTFSHTELVPIHDIIQHPVTHAIWIGTSKGLFSVNRKTNELVPAKDIHASRYISTGNVLQMIWKDDDELWIGGRDALYVYNTNKGNTERITVPTKNNEPCFIKSIHADASGLWIGTWGRGLQHYDLSTKTFTRYLPREDLGERSDANIVYNIAATTDKDLLWIACNDPGFLAFNKQSKKFVSYTAKDKTERKGIYSSAFSLYHDKKDGLWVGSSNGLYRYDPSLQVFHSHSLQNAISNYCLSNILTVYADPADVSGNTLFVGTWSCGTFNYDLEKRTIKPFPEWMQIKNEKRVTSFYRSSSHTLWMGIRTEGLKKFDERNKKITAYVNPDVKNQSPTSTDVNMIVEDGKILWLGTPQGLYSFDTVSAVFTNYYKTGIDSTHKFSDYISGLVKDHEGNIWFSTRLRSAQQCVIGKIKRGASKPEIFFYDPKDKTSLPENRIINGMALDAHHNIWLATWNGLLHWNTKDPKPKFLWVTSDNGLSNNRVLEVSCDAQNRIWAATLKGISCYDPASKIFRNYYSSDGLQQETVETLFKNPINDQLIAGYDGSFDVIHTKATLFKSAPQILITGLKIFNEPYRDNKKFMVDKGYISLESAQKNITINFTSLSFANVDQVKYAYKMEGVDRDWVITTNDFVSYSNLPQGDQRFLVKACNADGIWSKEPTWLDIYMAPPFYRTAWFIILCIVIASAILYLIYKNHIRRLQEKFRIRSTIARDLHDEIGSTLTSINILSRVSQSNLEKDKAKSSVLLHKITEQSQNMQQSMSDIIWAIKPENDKLENMAARMREYLSHTLEAKDIAIHFEADDKVLEENLSMEQRRDMFLIFKEAINNAAKYSNAASVHIQLHKQKNNIVLSITDEGTGFDTSLTRSSNGLKNMQMRAGLLNAKLEIISSPGNGTKLRLSVPTT